MTDLAKAPWVNASIPTHTWTWVDGSPSVWTAWTPNYPTENNGINGNCTALKSVSTDSKLVNYDYNLFIQLLLTKLSFSIIVYCVYF